MRKFLLQLLLLIFTYQEENVKKNHKDLNERSKRKDEKKLSTTTTAKLK